MRQIEAVIFDMDGLMLDTERLSMRVWLEAAKALALDLPEEIYLDLVGRPGSMTLQILRSRLGEEVPVEKLIEEANGRYLKAILTEAPPLKPGLLELLEFLDEEDIPKAVATSTRRQLALHKLESAGLAERFVAMTCGDEVKKGKPEPDIFLETARRLGVEPGRCLILEDSLHGAAGACAAGAVVVLVPDVIPPTDEVRRLVWRVLDSLEEVPDLIRGMIKGNPQGREVAR